MNFNLNNKSIYSTYRCIHAYEAKYWPGIELDKTKKVKLEFCGDMEDRDLNHWSLGDSNLILGTWFSS